MPTTFDGVKDGSTLVPCKDATARNDISTINGKIPSAASSSNKLVDTSAMNTAIGNAVSAAYKPAGTKTVAELVSGLLVAANKGNVYNITTAGTTTADFLEGAGKPIRIGDNVGICEPTSGTFKFDLLSGFVAVDENPTASSANPVSSGGVKTALDGKVDKVTGKGLSTNDYDNTAKAVVTTAQDNIIANTKLIKDTVGFSGKNKLDTSVVLQLYMDTGNSKYASNNDAHLCVARVLPNTKYNITKQAGTQFRVATSQNYPANDVSYTQTIANHTGTKIEITTGANDYYIGVYTTEADIPTCMVYDANILDPTYEPYYIPLKDSMFPRSEQAVLGAKNFLPNNNTTQTINGIPFTKNADGSVTIGAGTASANTSYILGDFKPKAGNYILSRGTTNGQAFLSVSKYNGSTWVAGLVEIGNQAISEKEFTVDYSGYDTLRGFIYIGSGVTISTPFTVYPMVRLATDPDDTYAPHAMTNKELTKLTYKKQGSALIETYTFAENISSDAAAVAKAGYIIMHTLRLIVSANIEANTVVITDGLGYAAVNIDMSFNTVFRTSAGDEYKMSIVTVSDGKVQLKTLTAIPNGTQLRGSIIFISQ